MSTSRVRHEFTLHQLPPKDGLGIESSSRSHSNSLIPRVTYFKVELRKKGSRQIHQFGVRLTHVSNDMPVFKPSPHPPTIQLTP